MIRSCFVVVALLASGAASAGMYTEEELVVPNPADLTKSIKQVVHTWSDDKHLKQDVPQLGGTVIIDLDKGRSSASSTPSGSTGRCRSRSTAISSRSSRSPASA
jgi:hypothetical protein